MGKRWKRHLSKEERWSEHLGGGKPSLERLSLGEGAAVHLLQLEDLGVASLCILAPPSALGAHGPCHLLLQCGFNCWISASPYPSMDCCFLAPSARTRPHVLASYLLLFLMLSSTAGVLASAEGGHVCLGFLGSAPLCCLQALPGPVLLP